MRNNHYDLSAIKAARKEKGLSKAEIARRLSMPYSTYDGYEKGTRIPDISTFLLICNELGKTPEEFIKTDTQDFRAYVSAIYDASDPNAQGFATVAVIKRSGQGFKEEYVRNIPLRDADRISQIVSLLTVLNESGQQKALEILEDLTSIARYTMSDEK